ncbi:MAG: 23S rRNA (adenine(2503)-C(2))-methyltransferase RlmN [Proteobacteria bacterium]|nr:23S rRNA (adenine(2503)-C(2))-methyltransferase RlmN [Pseudomonadota bacterium]
MLINILNFDRPELTSELTSRLGVEKFRSKQIIQWIYRQGINNFDEMTDISKSVRDKLKDHYTVNFPTLETRLDSIDGSRKYLWRLTDGTLIESVLIKQPKRYTLCISSQVGCAIGCKFCRTGLMGLKRNLETSEIIGQVLAVKEDIRKRGTLTEDFYNIVFMGMGEPLHNYDNVTRAVRLLNDNIGLDFTPRKITVSTSGLVPAIKKFGESAVEANLAISLNATTDEVRERIMPLNKKWPLKDLISTLKEFPLKNKKRLTLEYVLLKGVNDSDEDLKRLPNLIKDLQAKVNLIPYNENTGLGFYPPSREVIDKWQKTLLSKKVNSTIRWSKGQDISAACGQLATDSKRKDKAH